MLCKWLKEQALTSQMAVFRLQFVLKATPSHLIPAGDPAHELE